ncbi:MAG: hypothetical protein ACRCR6_08505 [Plesiomonas sp.]
MDSTTPLTSNKQRDQTLLEWSYKDTPPTGFTSNTTEYFYQLFDDRLEYYTHKCDKLLATILSIGTILVIVFLTFGLGLGPIALLLGLAAGKLIHSTTVTTTTPVVLARAEIRTLQRSEDHRLLNLTLNDNSQYVIYTDPDIYPTLTELLLAQGVTVSGEMITAGPRGAAQFAETTPTNSRKRTLITVLVVIWIGAAVIFSQLDQTQPPANIQLTLGTTPEPTQLLSAADDLHQQANMIAADESAYLAEKTANVKKLYANNGAFAAIKNDGSLITWGYGSQGANSSRQIQALHNIKEVLPFDGGLHGLTEQLGFFALTEDDRLLTWGETQAPAQLEPRLTQVSEVLTARRFEGMSVSFSMIAVLKQDGSVVTWASPQETNGNAGQANSLRGIQSITTAYGCFIALDHQGTPYVWGYKQCEQELAPQLKNRTLRHLRASGDQLLAEAVDGTSVVISNRAGTQAVYPLPEWAKNITEFHAAPDTNAALLNDGTLMYWSVPTSTEVKPRHYKQLAHVRTLQPVGIYKGAGLNWEDLLALTDSGNVININEDKNSMGRVFDDCNHFSDIKKIIPLPSQNYVLLYNQDESIYVCGDEPSQMRSYNGTSVPQLQNTRLYLQSYLYLTQGNGEVKVLMSQPEISYNSYAQLFAEMMQNSQDQLISNGSILSLNQDHTLMALTPEDKPAIQHVGKVQQALANDTGFAVLGEDGILHTWRTTGYMDEEFIPLPKEEL